MTPRACFRRRWLLGVLGAVLVGGCTAGPGGGTRTGPGAGPVDPCAPGYTQLLELLQDESRLDGLLLIKSVPPATRDLVERIARTAGRGARELRSLMAVAPAVTPGDSRLPEVEVRIRALTRGWTTQRLLSSSGAALEQALLVCQIEATETVRALCEALRREEASPQRVRALVRLRDAFAGLEASLRARLAESCGEGASVVGLNRSGVRRGPATDVPG